MVQQMNGRSARINLPYRFRIITEAMHDIFAVPYIVYMSERDELLMLACHGYPHTAVLMTSSDRGETWSAPYDMRTDEQGNPTVPLQFGLAYLGGGRVMTLSGLMSTDYGRTWPHTLTVPFTDNGKPMGGWDPVFVDRDPQTGRVTRLLETGYTCAGNTPSGGASQAYLRTSLDEGRTWSDTSAVAAWEGVNEVAITRAGNGDLVAACRTVVPERFVNALDHYEGLGVSLSGDNGQTWSGVNKLYDWGRHHPSMVLMPDGALVMTYVVRAGYVDAADGTPQFGIEAIVSRDHGQSWDLDHKYILASWKGNRTGLTAWWASSQATSTLLLPDGSLLTAFGTGYRSRPNTDNMPTPRDIGLVRWRLNDNSLNDDHQIADAPATSDLRNVFDPGLIDAN